MEIIAAILDSTSWVAAVEFKLGGVLDYENMSTGSVVCTQ